MRVLAEAKKVAKKSRIIVDRMSGCVRIKRTPSTMAGQLTIPFRVVMDFCWSTEPIKMSAKITARYDMALMIYTYGNPPAAMINPLMAGPMIDPVWLAMEFILKALADKNRLRIVKLLQ